MLNFCIKVILINFVPDMFVNVNQPDEAVFKVWETWASCLCHCKWHQHGYFIEFSDFDSSLSSSLCLGYKCGCNPVALKQWCGAQSHGRGSIDNQGEMEWNWSMIHQEEKRWTSLTFTSINSAWVIFIFNDWLKIVGVTCLGSEWKKILRSTAVIMFSFPSTESQLSASTDRRRRRERSW